MFNTDKPIINVSEDKFNRANLANQIAGAINAHNSDSSIVIGIDGPWGSGKTSFVNLIFSQLEKLAEQKNEQVDHQIMMSFHPWMCGDSQQMMLQFFLRLSEAINHYQDSLATLNESDKLKNGFIKITSTLINIGKVCAPLSSCFGIPGLRNSVEAGLEVADRAIQAYGKDNDIAQNTNLEHQKDCINKLLKEHKIKLIIHIDDIDRLTDTETRNVFQIVKALADFHNTIYILSFDRDLVASALNKLHAGKGQAYLEKIIQVPFEIPAINSDGINEIFAKMLYDITMRNVINIDNKDWQKGLANGILNYLTTIRAINRFINFFDLKYALLGRRVDLLDLIAITTIQLFEPNLYSKIYKECNRLYADDEFTSKRIHFKIQGTDVELNDQRSAEAIIEFLFDSGYNIGNNSDEVRLENIGARIRNRDYFQQYFELSYNF